MNKWFVILLILFNSCVEFEFEAPYEDLNGIYLEHVIRYPDVSGYKLLFEGNKGYILKESGLTCYSFASVDSIFEICSYSPGAEFGMSDFTISNYHAYIVGSDFFLIVNFQGDEPYLSTHLWITGARLIGLHNNYACVAGNNNLTIVDVHDKSNPEKVTEYMFGDFIRWLRVDSHYVYILLDNSDFCLLDISDPTDINLVSQVSVIDTLGSANMFALKDNYLYFLKNRYIETHQQSENGDLEYLSRTGFASYSMNFIHAGENYGLACSGVSRVYLLNLEHPSRPCITEIYELGWPQHYGIIRDNYIYLLVPYLEILEIKPVQ